MTIDLSSNNVTMIGQYVAFWIFCMFMKFAWLKRCEERPLNIIIDSTNATSREDFKVQLDIINNVTSKLRQGVHDAKVVTNIYQYNRNEMCRMFVRSNCVINSPNVTASPKRHLVISKLSNSKSLSYYKFPNQPFCLACAEFLREERAKEFGDDVFGLILTTYPSVKKFMNSSLHEQYRDGIDYYLALLYNSSHAGRTQVMARSSPNVYQIVERILYYICPERFPLKRKRAKETTTTTKTTPTTSKTTRTATTRATTKREETMRTVPTSTRTPINPTVSTTETIDATTPVKETSQKSTTATIKTTKTQAPAPQETATTEKTPTATSKISEVPTTIKATKTTITTTSATSTTAAMRSTNNHKLVTLQNLVSTHTSANPSISNIDKIVTKTSSLALVSSSISQMSRNEMVKPTSRDEAVAQSTIQEAKSEIFENSPKIEQSYTYVVIQATEDGQLENFTATPSLTPSMATEGNTNNASVTQKAATSFLKQIESTEIYQKYSSVVQMTEDERIENYTDASILNTTKSAEGDQSYTSIIRRTQDEKLENSTAISFLEPSRSTEIYKSYAFVVQQTKSEKLENSTTVYLLEPSKSAEIYNNYTFVSEETKDKSLENSTAVPSLEPSRSTEVYKNYTFVPERTKGKNLENSTTASLLEPLESTKIYKNYTFAAQKTKGTEAENSTRASFLKPSRSTEVYKNYTSAVQKTEGGKVDNFTAVSFLESSKTAVIQINYTSVLQLTMDKQQQNSTAISFLKPSKSAEMHNNYTFAVNKTKNEKVENSTSMSSLEPSKSTEIPSNYTFAVHKAEGGKVENSTAMSFVKPSKSTEIYNNYTSVVQNTKDEKLENSTTMLEPTIFTTTRSEKVANYTNVSTAMYKSDKYSTYTHINITRSIENSTKVLIWKSPKSIQMNISDISSSASIATKMMEHLQNSTKVTDMPVSRSSINSTIVSPEKTLPASTSSNSTATFPLKSKVAFQTNTSLVLPAMQTNRIASTQIFISTTKPPASKTAYASTIWSYMPPTSSIRPYMSSLTVHRSFDETTKTYFNMSTSIWPTSTYSSYFSSITYVPKYVNVIRNMELFMEQNITRLHAKQKSWVKNFVMNTSMILEEIERESDKHSLKENLLVRKMSLDFVEFLDNTTLMIGKELPVGKEVSITTEEIVVEISAFDPLKFNGYVFAPVSNEKQQQSIQLSSNIFKNSTSTKKVSVTSIFMDTIPAMRKTKGDFRDIGKVFTISLDLLLDYPREKTLTYSLRAPENNYSNYKCVFWNSTDWDTKGCYVANINGTLVTCECDHLTSFSILMQVNEFETHTSHAYVLSIISYIGCAISIAGCVLLMLTFMMCGRLLKVSRNVIHMNLALAMTISNGLFICADSVHMYKGICLTVSIAMLYSYLASFFWMLVEGLHVYLMIVKVFKSPSMIKVYLIIGWLLPAVIVTVAGMKFHVHFTRDDFCWISTDGNVIWVFVGPVLSIIAINTIILIKAISTSYKMALAENAFLKLQETARLTMLLMPIFGLTWVFGLLAINKQLIVFQYLFTITNSLQGLYIFLCYCVLNNEVKQEFERIRRKYQYGSGQSTSSESNFSVYNQLFNKRSKAKSVVSMDASNMVRLTRYDSVKTDSTSPSRSGSMQSDSLAKRLNKFPIELINLNESMSLYENKIMEVNDSLSVSSSLCPEEHDYGLRLKYDEVPLTNGHHHRIPANHHSTDELANGTYTYDTFKRKK